MKRHTPIAHRCACGEWACFHEGDRHWCGKCVPAEFFVHVKGGRR